ncbi:2-hydroxyacid dehydrogenase [Sphingomonas paeninsulae]|uniref:2-hydroxyacid dehydrogenase n=1 Tax=Sphingomonas paeninsulae TaxID=2319844 RepID=A0A494TN20_SPHPE|nr:2-hydroxyacid dehydrogenase [Sphingomonas paeninsulae]AYJ87251.1 2-hydroxyacid dehydrogenase [Sphingomonas paeninsulae]
MIDLFLATDIPAPLETALSARFRLFRGSPPTTTRAIVGGGMSAVDAALIASLPALEIIAVHGVGHDRIDLDAATRAGVRVTLTPDVLTDDVADLAIGLMLAVQRRIPANDRAVRHGNWRVPNGRRASGRRIGLFGMGLIGQSIASRAAPFASETLYTSRTAKAWLPYRFVPDLAELATASDVLIVAASGGTETAKAVNADILDRLGRDGVLINIARGGIVDETALVAALLEGRIYGAGLDVFAHEPIVPDALKTLDTVVLQSHQGSATQEARAAMAVLVLANLDAHFTGQPLLTAIN